MRRYQQTRDNKWWNDVRNDSDEGRDNMKVKKCMWVREIQHTSDNEIGAQARVKASWQEEC